MEFKKVELINVPKPHNHLVEIAKVKQIAAKELQIGDIVLFGFHLLLIEGIKLVGDNVYHGRSLSIKSLNLATGDSGSIGYPVNSVFSRVIECEITEMEQLNVTAFYTWKRLRRPILGEMQICGICHGDCGAMVQDGINEFDTMVREGALDAPIIGSYEPTRDVFLGYDGCEEPSTER